MKLVICGVWLGGSAFMCCMCRVGGFWQGMQSVTLGEEGGRRSKDALLLPWPHLARGVCCMVLFGAHEEL